MARRTLRQDAPTLVRLPARPAERAHICSGSIFRTERGTLVLTTVTLAYSHAVWAEFGVEVAEWALAPVLEHAWEFFGGVPHAWLLETVRPSAPLEPAVRALARRCGATVRPFTETDGVRWGEWALRAVPERLLRRHFLRDCALGNRLLRVFVDEMLWRDHPQLRERRVYEVLAEERAGLWPVGVP
jgi:hypothetical protein